MEPIERHLTAVWTNFRALMYDLLLKAWEKQRKSGWTTHIQLRRNASETCESRYIFVTPNEKDGWPSYLKHGQKYFKAIFILTFTIRSMFSPVKNLENESLDCKLSNLLFICYCVYCCRKLCKILYCIVIEDSLPCRLFLSYINLFLY